MAGLPVSSKRAGGVNRPSYFRVPTPLDAQIVMRMNYSPPGIIFKPKPWAEIWAGMFGIYNKYDDKDNSWELRPLTGVKFYVPNQAHLNLFNFTRFEYRYVNQSGSSTTTPRLRNRVGLEAPFSQANAWKPQTWYGLADVEYFWRLDDGYLERYRIRSGIGYNRE